MASAFLITSGIELRAGRLSADATHRLAMFEHVLSQEWHGTCPPTFVPSRIPRMYYTYTQDSLTPRVDAGWLRPSQGIPRVSCRILGIWNIQFFNQELLIT